MPDRAQVPFRGALAAALEQATGESLALALPGLLRAPSESLPVAPASDRSVWSAAASAVDAVGVRELLGRAQADLAEVWGVPLASAAARVHRDGNRDAWEAVVFARQRRLSRSRHRPPSIAASARDRRVGPG